MIPASGSLGKQHLAFGRLPSKTFALHPNQETLVGHVQELEAVRQAIYVILNVERYAYLIHSWNIGVELADLMGRPVSFCLPEIKRRIAEALLQDDRITEVGGFAFAPTKGKVHVTFLVSTIFGRIQAEKEVAI